MWLKKAASSMESGLAPLISVIGKIGTSVIALMMLLTVADVVGRRIFNEPVSGAYELSQFMLVIVVFFAIVHCEFTRGHIAIDLVTSRFRQRTQDIIASIMYIFFLVTFALLTRQLIVHAFNVWHNNLVTGTLRLPIFPLVFVAAFGSALLSLVVLIYLLSLIAEALKR